MAQLGEGLRLDLTDALARHAKFAANLLERAGMAIDEAEAKLDNLALAIGKGVENLGELLLKHREARGLRGNDGLGILDEVTQLRILFLANASTEVFDKIIYN